MYERLRQVGVLRLVQAAVTAYEPARRHVGQHVLKQCAVHQVDVLLRVAAQVHVAEAAVRIALLREQRVEHEGIAPVGVQSRLRVRAAHLPQACRPRGRIRDRHGDGLRLVLRGEQQLVPGVLGVVQHRPAALPFLVIHVRHQRLIPCVGRFLRAVAAQHAAAGGQPSRQMRVTPLQCLRIREFRVEYPAAVLYVRHAGLPEQIQQVDLPDGDIPQPVVPGRIPEHAVHAGAALELVPPHVAPHLVEPVLLQDHGQDVRQHLGLRPVALLPRQTHRPGVTVAGVAVLAEDHVHQPAGGRLRSAAVPRADLFPVPQLPGLLRVDDPLFQLPLSRPAAGKLPLPPAHLFLPDGLSFAIFKHLFSPSSSSQVLLFNGFPLRGSCQPNG